MKKLIFWALLLGIATKEAGNWLWAHVPDTGWLGDLKSYSVSAYTTISGWDKGDWTVVGSLASAFAAYTVYRRGRKWWGGRGSAKSVPASIRSADDAIRNSVGHATDQLPKLIKRAMDLVAKAERKGFTKVSMNLEKQSPIARKLLVDGLVELQFKVKDPGQFAGENPSEYPDEVVFSFPLKQATVAAAVGTAPTATKKVAFGPTATMSPSKIPTAWWKSAWNELT